MEANRRLEDRVTKRIRRTARITGSIIGGVWLFVGIAHAIQESGPPERDGIIMAILMITSVIGVIVAWWREKIGGTILIIVGIAHCIFAYLVAGRNRGFAMLVSGVPFLVIGALFLVAWWRSEAKRPARA